MERNLDVNAEADDFKHALAISRDLSANGRAIADAVEIMAQWCATLREHYVQIGRNVEQDEQQANIGGNRVVD